MPCVNLLRFGATLLAIALTSESFLGTTLLAGLQVEGVTFDLLDDVFLLHFALETAKSAFERFAFLHNYFCQIRFTPSG